MNSKAEALKQRTFRFARVRHRVLFELARQLGRPRTVRSLFRCGTRVGANYHAARRARSPADFVNKLGIVVEEADESVYWLRLIHAANVRRPPAAPLLQEASELWAIVNQSQLTARANSRNARAKAAQSVSRSVNS